MSGPPACSQQRNHAARPAQRPATAPPPSRVHPRYAGVVDPGENHMANLADDYGTDVEIYVKALTTTIHADTPAGAPTALHVLLEQLGLERHEHATGGPVYIWHTVPEHLGADEQKRVATRAVPVLLLAGYEVNCTSDVFDEAAYRQAVRSPRPCGPPCRTATGTGRLPLAPGTGPPRPVRRPGGPIPGEIRSSLYTPTDQQPAQAPARNRLVPPLSARLYPDRTRPDLHAGRHPPGGRRHRNAARRAAPQLTVHRPGGACPTPPPTR